MYKWLIKEKTGGSLTCNVDHVSGFTYIDFEEVFGKPSVKAGDKYGFDRATWKLSTYDGKNFQVRFDSTDYGFRKIRREKIKKLARVELEEVDEAQLMGEVAQIQMLKSFFEYIFNNSQDKPKAILQYIFGELK